MLFTIGSFMWIAESLAQKYIEVAYQDVMRPTENELKFYQEAQQTVNHLRDIRYGELFNVLGLARDPQHYHEYIFSVLTEGKKQVLIQGDSWAEQFSFYTEYPHFILAPAEARQKFEQLKHDFTIIAAGIGSYSPSLMAAQLDMLVEKYEMRPQLVVAIISQGDIGDEICHYRTHRSKKNGRITVAPFATARGDTPHRYMNFTSFFGKAAIVRDDDFALLKLVRLAWYHYVYLAKFADGAQGCRNKEDYLIKPLTHALPAQDYDYFTETMLDYIRRVFSYEFVERMVIVTHFDRGHITGEYHLDVGAWVNEAIARSAFKDRIDSINFTPSSYGDSDLLPLFQKEDTYSHLTNRAHAGLYSDTIIEWIKEHR